MSKKLLMQPANLSNPLKLDSKFLKQVIRELQLLAELNEALAVKAIRYVVDGSDEDVLLELVGKNQADEALLLSHTQWSHAHSKWAQVRKAMKERASLLRSEYDVPAELYIRLAEVYLHARLETNTKADGPTGWPDWLTTLIAEYELCSREDERTDKPLWPLAEIEEMLTLRELPTDLFLRAMLNEEERHAIQVGSRYYWYANHGMVLYSGWPEHFTKHLDAVRELLSVPDAKNRLHALEFLLRNNFDFLSVVDLLVEFATSSSKMVREQSLPILKKLKKDARPLLEKTLAEGKAAERHEAVNALWKIYGDDAEELLRNHLETESSDRVKQTLNKLLAAPVSEAESDMTASDFELSPVEVETGKVELTEAAKEGLKGHFDNAHKKQMAHYEQLMQQFKSPNRPKWLTKPVKPKPMTTSLFNELIDFVEGKKANKTSTQLRQFLWQADQPGDWLGPPDVKLIHLIRLAHAWEELHIDRGRDSDSIHWYPTTSIDRYRSRCEEPFDLRAVAACIAELPNGKDAARKLTISWLANNNNYYNFLDWEKEAVWPLFAENLDVLEQMLGASPNLAGNYQNYDYSWSTKRRNAFRVLAMFPKLPAQFVPILWDIALGEAKTDRPLAQAALEKVPNKATKIIVALGDGKQGVRAAAADWLAEIGDKEAIEPLKEAFRKEKRELVKGRIMVALERLGADVNEFMNREKLLEESKKGLEKKRPKGMEWIPLDRFPAVHWQDSGEEVDSRIIQWWIVQCVQQKQPASSPLIRRYLQMCRETEAMGLAKFILQTWITHDTRTLSHEECSERAKADAKSQWKSYGKHPWYKDRYKNEEGLYKELYQTYSNNCIGSAIDQKGMLAIVAAAGGRDCVRLAEQYVRKHMGQRLAQSKALVEVLSWIDHPMAIQVLLSISNRFKTKALQKLAGEHVQALADREGWTLDELADRTIPDGGFARETDEDGEPIGTEAVLTLDYGSRSFTVTLNDELQPVVTNEDGKVLKNPPAPGKNDDAEQAKAAKKSFSEAKKIVKDVIKQQTIRMYEGLCTQRVWNYEDWKRFLADHPIMGRLCTRLIWCAYEGEDFVTSFRPLEDGSFTNEQDDEVTLNPNSQIRLAHTCNLPKEVGDAWLQHLEDYDITPLFEQFGRETYELPEDRKNDTDINDFMGHMLTTFQLRGKATKLGYIRGEIIDGGGFNTYNKPFPSLGLQAEVEFTGSYVPEEDLSAALISLYFTKLKSDGQSDYTYQTIKLPLSKVPPVLLSECYNDLKQMAAMGTGFDEAWQNKSWM